MFTFMHLADAFIQSDLHLPARYTLSVHAFPGSWTHDLGIANLLFELPECYISVCLIWCNDNSMYYINFAEKNK